MVRIVKTEFYKLKRYHILWAGVALMLLSVLLTLFTSMANDGSVWDFAYLTEQVIKNNMSMIFPMCISLIAGYMISREQTDDTLKNILTVPISFKKLLTGKLIVCGVLSITGYTEWVLKFSLGWQNCMPAFTTIINNVYLILVPVGILIGSRSDDFAGFAMTFIFYLLFVPAISGVLNKIMYISESFMQIDGNVARMDEILNIPEMPETSHPKKPVGDDVAFHDVSFSYTGDVSEKALENVSFSAK